MGYLLQILSAIVVIGLVEEGVALDLRLPILMPFLAVVPALLGRFTKSAYLQGKFKRGAILSAALNSSPPVLFFIMLAGLGWRDSVVEWLGTPASLFGWPDFSVLTVLFPFVLYQSAAIDVRARLSSATEIGRKSLRNLQLRMFFASLAPILLYVLLASVVGVFEPLRVSVEEVSVWGALFGAFAVLVLAFALPFIVRNTWDTEPVPPGIERDLLDEIARQAGFRSREILIWRTGNLMANAAIIGLTPGQRVVLFSDALLAQLQLRELAAVFAHEIGHAARRHVPIFTSWAIAFFLGIDLIAIWLDIESLVSATLLLAASLVIGYLGFGYLSRRFELDADLYAMELMRDPIGLIQALETVGGRQRDVVGWRHFSTNDRVRFLNEAGQDPSVAERLRRKLRLFTIAGAVALVVVSSLQARELMSRFDKQSLIADLRLGRYEHAVERAGSADLGESGEFLAQSVERLLEEVGDESALPVTLFAQRARLALRADEPEDALSFLKLASLREADELKSVATVLESALKDEKPFDAERLDELPPSWAEELRLWLERR